jgi:gas vesicle structural protein
MTVAVQSANRAPRPSGLADVLDLVLDKGIVIDAYVRLAVVGIEILTLDARIVIASVDTYLRFAEAVNRLDLQPHEQVGGLPGLVGELQEGGAQKKTKGALSGVKDSAKEVASSLRNRGDDDDDDNGGDDGDGRRPRRAPAKRSAPSKRSAPRGRRPARRRGEDNE